MRASRAGLILTPHRIAELGGPTSHGRQEARPLVWLPILGLFPVGSHGGAAGRLLERSTEKQRAEPNRKDRAWDKIPYSLSFPCRRTNYKTLPLGWIIPVFGHVIKDYLSSLKSWFKRFQATHISVVLRLCLFAKLTTELILRAEKQH